MQHIVKIGKKSLRTDFGLILILLLMFATSCFALYNCFNLMREGTGQYYLNRQIMWYAIGFLVMFVIHTLGNKIVYRYLDPFYNFLLVILVYLLASKLLFRLTGHTLPLAAPVNGAYSWLQVPLLGSFQASEFMKVCLIIKSASIISDFQKNGPLTNSKTTMGMLLAIGRWAIPPMILVLLQPDTGLFIITAFTLMLMVMCSGIPARYVITLIAILVGVIGLLFYLFFFHLDFLASFVSQYQLNRIEAWLHPDDYILGSSNQLYTALLSLGSAGLTGHGLQANIISIPEAYTDFIFAAFGQCFGLLGTIYILIICLVLDIYLCKMAYNLKDLESKLIIIGTIAMLFYQQFQNLGMIVGLVPITGITLPLISYGGSSTLSYFILFGIILNISPTSSKVLRLFAFKKRKASRPKRLRRKRVKKTMA